MLAVCLGADGSDCSDVPADSADQGNMSTSNVESVAQAMNSDGRMSYVMPVSVNRLGLLVTNSCTSLSISRRCFCRRLHMEIAALDMQTKRYAVACHARQAVVITMHFCEMC